jgi:PAS domain S-box-containing protein
MADPTGPDPVDAATPADWEGRFRAFMDSCPAVAWMKDEAGRYVYLSRRHEERFGVTLADWAGKTDFDIWPADVARQFRENDRAVLAGGKAVEAVESATHPDGSVSHWWVFKFPFVDAAGQRFVGGVGVDVTERERAKAELRQANDDLRRALDQVRRLEQFVTLCAWTKRVKVDGRWVTVEEFLRTRFGVTVSHGMSDAALALMEREMTRPPADAGPGDSA